MNKFVLTIVVLLPIKLMAQVDWENPKGAIKTEEIVIEKDKQLTLPHVSRRFKAIEVAPVVVDTSSVTYSPKNVIIKVPKVPVSVRPRTMKSELLDPVHWGIFKLGYGSYISPFLQGDVATKRNDAYALAAHFKHFSSNNGPVDNSNSGMSTNDLFLSGNLFLNKATLSGQIGYNFNKYMLYGYAPPPNGTDVIVPKQNFSDIEVALQVTDNDLRKPLFYKLGADMHAFKVPNRAWNENDFHAFATLSIPTTSYLKISVASNVHVASQNNALTSNSRLLFGITPFAAYNQQNLSVEAGAGIFVTKDSINSYQPKWYIVPHVKATYSITNNFSIEAAAVGDITWQSARLHFEQNPYLNNTVINNLVNPIHFYTVAHGNILSNIDASLGYHLKLFKLYDQYVNNLSNQAVFDIEYLQGANWIHQFEGTIAFAGSANLNFSLFGTYSFFNFETQNRPYHVPQLTTGVNLGYQIKKKLTSELILKYMDGIYAYDQPTSTEIKLNPILDINLNAGYSINTTFGIFVKLQNLVGNEYQYLYHYPVKGFQAMAGVSITL